MKILIALIVYIISSIASAEWQAIPNTDYKVNYSTGEFWNQKAGIGGTLNADLSIALLETNATLQLIDELNSANETVTDEEPVSLYARRTTRSELFDAICDFFHVDRNSFECNNVRKISMATFGMIMKKTARGEQVKIQGFGNWGLRKMNARAGRNPYTGEPVHIPAYRRVEWRPNETYACIVDDADRSQRTMCQDNNNNGDYLLAQIGSDLRWSVADEGFTATTNLDPPPALKTITTSTDGNGFVTPTYQDYVGKRILISVLPKTGFKFKSWSNSYCNGGIINNWTTYSCTAYFERI